jgi:hypothetical protein
MKNRKLETGNWKLINWPVFHLRFSVSGFSFSSCLLPTLFLALMSVQTLAVARQVDVPLTFDYEFVRQALIAQVYTGPNEKAIAWDDGTGCAFLKLRDPSVSGAGRRLRVVSRGEARVGTPIGDQCLAPIQWEGFLEVFEEPEVSADQRLLRFRVVQSNIYDDKWKKGFLTGKLWDLMKEQVQPRLESVRIDLNEPVRDVRDILPLLFARADTARIEEMLSSIRLAAASVSDTGVHATLSFTVSDVTPAAAPTPEPTLTAEELRRWEEAWQRWDAFLTFTIKQFDRDTLTGELRQALTDVLIDGRYDIIEALAPSAPGAPDPTRVLFIKTWERLVPVVRQSAALQAGTTALRYMGFIAAGDALAALDQVAPDIGLDISADGLRRLARIVAPLSTEDPLAYNTNVDPELRQLSGFGPPLPPPDLSGAPSGEAWWRHWVVASPAFAAAEAPNPKALERWLPPDRNAVDAYLAAVHEVLGEVTQKTLAGAGLQDQYHKLYQQLVLATAWQESCWRQFLRSNGAVTYMKSAIGSVGLMQINEHVWRGFYDVRGLRWDIRYNARAGAEILMRYLRDYAVARAKEGGVNPTDFLARATYAVYNGGPGHLTRFLKKNLSKTLRRIDDLFWEKYQAITKNDQTALARCLVGG